MTWQEFNAAFDMTVFKKLMSHMNGESEQKVEAQKKDRQKRKNSYDRYSYRNYQYLSDDFSYEILPMQELNHKYQIKYLKKSKTKNNVEEIVLGYFQEFEKGWIFISLDSSHMWKKLRELIQKEMPDIKNMIMGSNMVFCDLSEIEFDTRYYLIDSNGKDETSFLFKNNCVRINDVYVGSNKSFRYFLILDFAYTSSDFTTNNFVSCETFFDHIKELSNADILVIFDQRRDLKDYQEVMQKYSDKMLKKLLKI